jgi:hypothetical protein
MIRSKRGLALLGLCGAVAIGLVALASSAVQAEAGAKWSLVNTKGELLSVTSELLPTVLMAKIATGDMTLLFTTKGGTKVELLCLHAEFLNARLETEGTIGGENKTRFSECTTKLNGSLSPACEPHTGAEKGVVTSKALRGLIKLYELKPSGVKDTVVLFEPVTGTEFMSIEVGKGSCAIGEVCTITGKNSIQDANNELGVEKTTHSVEQGPLNELSVNGQPAFVDGVGVLQLSGTHEGFKWAGTPA